jgi:hypothetical protein
VLDRLATDQRRDLGWTTLRTVAYVGPRQSAGELATLSELARQSLAKAPPEVRRKWLTPAAWTFPRLSQPQSLLEQTLDGVGAKQSGAVLPHDLWPARSLPAIAPIDRVVLLLAGFDLALAASPDGRLVRAATLQRPVRLTRDYPASERLEAALADLAAADDAVSVRRQGRRVTVSARWEDHERLRSHGRSQTSRREATADSPPRLADSQRFTLRVASKPVGPVLTQLAAQLQLTIVWEPALAASRPEFADALVSCNVRDVDLDGLLTAILEPAELTYDRNGQAITIRAAK